MTPLLLLLWGCGDILGTAGDGGPFRLREVEPEPGSKEVSVLDSLTLRFSQDLDPSSVASGVSVRVGGRPLRVTYSIHSGNVLRVVPTDPLDFGTEHEIGLSLVLRSRGGASLEASASLAFTTEGSSLPSMDGDSLLAHVEALAHDSMRGRASGSADELKAALYLRNRFLDWGLRPPERGMIQPFSALSLRGDTLLFSQNVLAVLPGAGPLAQEWIVVGGHYDHIGFRHLTDAGVGPNNGADDNASGTAVVLELAHALAEWVTVGGAASVSRRSVLFAGWGAEEEGLLGSCHYVFQAPAVPLERTGAVLNFDMVGRLREDVLSVSGGETAEAWEAMVENSNVSGLVITRPTESSAGGTDHACFWRAAIPWEGFFTRLHAQYHSPGDDVELLEPDGMARIGDLALRVLVRLMVMPQSPAFQGAIPG